MTALDDAIRNIERSFGAGSVMRGLSDAPLILADAIPTGALTLDLALGGGMPRGRIVEVYGPESSGKTTVVQHVIANAQASGLTCAFIDAEHAFDPSYAKATGVDVDSLLFSQPDYGEQALNIACDLIETGELGVIAIDSVAALTPKAELDGEVGDMPMGAQARMMSQFMRKVAANAQKTRTLVIMVNQIREKIGVIFGSPETTPGGRALRFYASQRLDVRRVKTEGPAGEQTHNATKVTIRKNKVAPPFRLAFFDIEFGKGISTSGCLLDLGIERGLIAKSGSFFSFEGERLGQGRANSKAALEADSDMAERLRAQIVGRVNDPREVTV